MCSKSGMLADLCETLPDEKCDIVASKSSKGRSHPLGQRGVWLWHMSTVHAPSRPLTCCLYNLNRAVSAACSYPDNKTGVCSFWMTTGARAEFKGGYSEGFSWRGYVFTPVCLLVGWFVSRIAQELLNGFPQNLGGGWKKNLDYKQDVKKQQFWRYFKTYVLCYRDISQGWHANQLAPCHIPPTHNSLVLWAPSLGRVS